MAGRTNSGKSSLVNHLRTAPPGTLHHASRTSDRFLKIPSPTCPPQAHELNPFPTCQPLCTVNSKYLAKASSRPGKTKNIDLYMVRNTPLPGTPIAQKNPITHFSSKFSAPLPQINKQFIFADLPGYEFGRDPGTLHSRWEKTWKPLIYTYLKDSPVKAAIFVADIRYDTKLLLRGKRAP